MMSFPRSGTCKKFRSIVRALSEDSASSATIVALFASFSFSLYAAEDFHPQPGKFPPITEATSHRGELVFVDHVNRRGGLRLHIDGFYREMAPHAFAMLPYGAIYYRGAPAELRDIPIGTVMYGRFYLPPDPETSAVPVIKKARLGVPRENHAILLEDGPSLCLREGKRWKLKEVEIKRSEGVLVVSLDRNESGEGLGGEHKITIDGSTRIWRGRELLGFRDVWPKIGKETFDDKPIQLSLTWHPRYLYQQFHAADLWLDERAMKVATERQRQVHIRHIRHRWMPAWIDAVEYGKFGDAVVTATLFGGMDGSLYADFKPGSGGQMCVSENSLRTYWQNHDGMEGKIESVVRSNGQPPFGSSGIQIKFSMNLVLEGFRPGRIVRIRPNSWPRVKPPREEQIKGFNERWPSPDIFSK